LLLMTLLLPLCIHAQKMADGLVVKKVLIFKVPESLQTQIGVSCNDFESSFNQTSIFKTFQLNSNNEDGNKKILALKKAFENHKEAIYTLKMLDVRAKIYIIYENGQVDCACIAGVNLYSYNGSNISFDSSSYEVVRQIVWGNEQKGHD